MAVWDGAPVQVFASLLFLSSEWKHDDLQQIWTLGVEFLRKIARPTYFDERTKSRYSFAICVQSKR